MSSGGPPPSRVDSLDKLASHFSRGDEVLAIRRYRGLHGVSISREEGVKRKSKVSKVLPSHCGKGVNSQQNVYV